MNILRAIALMTFCLFCFSNTSLASGLGGIMDNGRVYVPAQMVFEELGCQVIWDKTMQVLLLKNGQNRLTVDLKTEETTVNGKTVSMPYKPRLENGALLVPLRFCVEAMGMKVDWDDTAKRAIVMRNGSRAGRTETIKTVIPVAVVAPAKQPDREPAASTGALRERYRSFSKEIGGHQVNVVEIAAGALKADLGLAQNRVGATEELASIATRSGAVLAINGSYFEAYGGAPDPCNLLIREGKVLHAGSNGSAIGFTRSGKVKTAPVKVKIEGATKGSYQWPNNWYSYGFNHTGDGGSSVYIYTPERGSKVGFDGGTAVTVTDGRISRIVANNNAPIPPNGFVAVFSGSERSLLERFSVGLAASYRVVFEGTEGESWSDVITAVGAGPRLVARGKAAVDAAGEGFTEAKIIESSGARSAIGVRQDGTVLLVTTSGATMNELASIMQSLGAWQALNLDGGASSGLWVEGAYVTEPGRALSNALIFR